VNAESEPKEAEFSESNGNGDSMQAVESDLATVIAERDQLAAEKAELLDRHLRSQAEFQNIRRRAERERQELLDYANTETLRPLLVVLDDFERALKVETTDREYAKGMEMIHQRLYDAMKKLGWSRS
jgi:molecular chaperone GrpE